MGDKGGNGKTIPRVGIFTIPVVVRFGVLFLTRVFRPFQADAKPLLLRSVILPTRPRFPTVTRILDVLGTLSLNLKVLGI